ncbi:hypothetical protein [Modicisalibacter luteus]|uniref:hypothetical protein n=1 Tax=Modicisalibacter luteus TaxID=453962 RepID=UPI0036329C2B
MSPDTVPSNYGQADIGIVHLGLGAFHRAHQAVYLEQHLARHGGSSGWGSAAPTSVPTGGWSSSCALRASVIMSQSTPTVSM